MDQRGIFIVLEGTDGSGKDTQFKLLKERLSAYGYDVAVFDFPQYDSPSSYFVKQYLNGVYGNAADIGPYSASLFYALDRYEAASQIRQALAEGKIVLANRYAGSNMAHQGGKFQHSEERRGFFIWDDSLEFQMLGIPRPLISFVLRMPAEMAQALIGQKQARQYTDKKHDIHETDIEHIRRSVEVYDELCRLFPRDFFPIDCTRDGQLLSIPTINNLIWRQLESVLPAPPAKTSQPVRTAEAPVQSAPEVTQPAPNADVPALPPEARQLLIIEETSLLLASSLEHGKGGKYLTSVDSDYRQRDSRNRYQYYLPKHLKPTVRQRFSRTLDEIFHNYSGMYEHLSSYLNAHDPSGASAKEILRAVLPVAARTSVGVVADAGATADLINRLRADVLPEAKQTADHILEQIGRTEPKLAKDINVDKKTAKRLAETSAEMQRLSERYLPNNHANPATAVKLDKYWPANELDLVADMLYPHSDQPLSELLHSLEHVKYKDKEKMFRTYLGARDGALRTAGSTLEKVRYNWDLMTDYDVYCQIQRRSSIDGLERQTLSPRYGFEVPEIIDKAGLTDDFEHCFDLSARLYSELQAAGYENEAQYATLVGHKLRWKMSINARGMAQLFEEPGANASSSMAEILEKMSDSLAEVHPLLANGSFISKKDVPNVFDARISSHKLNQR